MKRYLISTVAVGLLLALAPTSFAQSQEQQAERARARGRRWMGREHQLQAIAAIEEQLAKIKSSIESFSGPRQRWQDLSEEERSELREKFMKFREQRQRAVAVIERQLAKLKGSRQLTAEHDRSIAELKALHGLAVKEKATETAAAIGKLIAKKEKAFKEKLNKLGLQRRGPREAGSRRGSGQSRRRARSSEVQ